MEHACSSRSGVKSNFRLGSRLSKAGQSRWRTLILLHQNPALAFCLVHNAAMLCTLQLRRCSDTLPCTRSDGACGRWAHAGCVEGTGSGHGQSVAGCASALVAPETFCPASTSPVQVGDCVNLFTLLVLRRCLASNQSLRNFRWHGRFFECVRVAIANTLRATCSYLYRSHAKTTRAGTKAATVRLFGLTFGAVTWRSLASSRTRTRAVLWHTQSCHVERS